MFVIRKFVKISIDWLGGYDSYRAIYLLYILLGLFVLRKKYVDWNRHFYLFFRFLQVLGFLACSFCFFAFIYDAYLKRGNIERLSYNLGTTIFYTVALCRLIYLAQRKDGIEETLNMINHNLYLWDVGSDNRDLEILNNGEREFKNISKVCYGFCFAGILSKVLCHVISEKSLMIPFPIYEDIQSPYYEILFLCEAAVFSHFVFVETCQNLVTFGAFIRISAHFMILSKNIDQLTGVCFPVRKYLLDGAVMSNLERFRVKNNSKWQQEKTSSLLRKNVMHHQEIMKVIENLRTLMQEVFFIQIFGTGLLLVDLLFHLSLQRGGITLMVACQFVYSIVSLLNISILCYYGSEIQSKSHDVAIALYSIPWLELDVKNRKMLLFFQMALWKQPTIKAGNVFSVNLNMYVKFVHSIYTYLAFMQKTLKTLN